MSDFSNFEKNIVEFKDKGLLKRAFTHRSYLNENPSECVKHNERLEFLGDAVLELASTEFLFSKFPEKAEGEMTSLRAAMVNTKMISEVAGELGFGGYLLLSKGEEKEDGRARQSILADTFEAVVGAIFIDQGYDTAQRFLVDNLFPKLKKIIDEKLWIDAKSLFQEKAQEVVNTTPTYKTIKEWGPDHEKTFTIGVFIGPDKIAEGEGASKQEAEQSAARAGLEAKGWE